MPSDSNGNYSLPDGYLGVTGEPILASQHNTPLEDLALAMSGRLLRSGAAAMTGALKGVTGSESAPAFAFASSTNSGVYLTTTGVGVAVNGVKIAEFRSGGGVVGARYVGELFHTSLTQSTPALCVRPYGQTLLRSAYPDLWALAQTEIAAGNLFYSNGNGTTTFGIGDLRGRFLAGRDNMGGSAASRITLINGQVVGNQGGAQSHTLLEAELAAHYHGANIYDPGHVHSYSDEYETSSSSFPASGGQGGVAATKTKNTDSATTGIQINSSNGIGNTYSAGSSTPFSILPPTMITDIVLFAGA